MTAVQKESELAVPLCGADYASQVRSNGSDRRREQRRLCNATAAQRQRPSMHSASESSADCGEAMATTEHPARRRAWQTMLRYDEATAATEHRSRRRDYARIQRSIGSSDRASSRQRAQRRLCGAMAATEDALRWRERPSTYCDGSRADFALLRRSNGSVISCITTARAALVSHGQPSFSSHIMFNMFLCEHTLSFSNGSCH